MYEGSTVRARGFPLDEPRHPPLNVAVQQVVDRRITRAVHSEDAQGASRHPALVRVHVNAQHGQHAAGFASLGHPASRDSRDVSPPPSRSRGKPNGIGLEHRSRDSADQSVLEVWVEHGDRPPERSGEVRAQRRPGGLVVQSIRRHSIEDSCRKEVTGAGVRPTSRQDQSIRSDSGLIEH